MEYSTLSMTYSPLKNKYNVQQTQTSDTINKSPAGLNGVPPKPPTTKKHQLK